MVADAAGNPIRGLTVTFAAPPTSGPGGAFAGDVNFALTDGTGVATSGLFTANGIAGSYSVAASVSGLVASANLTLTNTSGGVGTAGTISAADATIGQNLQAPILIVLNPPAPAGGVNLTIQSTDPSLALVGSGLVTGRQMIVAPIAAGLDRV